jgi:hypothetical protein
MAHQEYRVLQAQLVQLEQLAQREVPEIPMKFLQ